MGLEKLKKEMSEAEKEITKNKIAIADLFLDIYRSKPSDTPTFDEFLEHIKDMAKMPLLIAELEKNETRYHTMLDAKLLVESTAVDD